MRVETNNLPVKGRPNKSLPYNTCICVSRPFKDATSERAEHGTPLTHGIFASLFSLVNRTLYIEGEKKLAFASWCAAIQAAAGSGGDSLSQQQLIDADIPVIVNSCISYITQFGETRTHTLHTVHELTCRVAPPPQTHSPGNGRVIRKHLEVTTASVVSEV